MVRFIVNYWINKENFCVNINHVNGVSLCFLENTYTKQTSTVRFIDNFNTTLLLTIFFLSTKTLCVNLVFIPVYGHVQNIKSVALWLNEFKFLVGKWLLSSVMVTNNNNVYFYGNKH